MRSVLIVAAAVVALGALGGLVVARLGGTLAQMRAIDLHGATLSSSGAAHEPAPAARGAAPPQRDAPQTPDEIGGSSRAEDAHIMRWLAADPTFMRSAEELLNDPDPQVQIEARQLLRDLGAPVSASNEGR